MRDIIIVHPAVVLVLLLSLWGCSSRQETPVPFAEPPHEVDSKSLKSTVFASNLEEAIPPGKNLVYCATFQLAWNELRDEMIGEDVRLAAEPPMVAKLNRKAVTKDMVPNDAYVAMVGFGKDEIVRRINEALVKQFGNAAPVVEEEMAPGDILAYAYLLRVLRFAAPFEKLAEPLQFGSGEHAAPVAAFGIKEYNSKDAQHRQMASQVEVFAYDESPEEFAVRIAVDSESDELILAKLKPRETLRETIDAARGLTAKHVPKPLNHEDTLQIPRVSFNVAHSYDELMRKELLNEGFELYVVTKAYQSVQFTLCEAGVQVASEARIRIDSIPRRLVFDGPFMVLLRRAGSEMPYLAIWIADAELLEGFGGEPAAKSLP